MSWKLPSEKKDYFPKCLACGAGLGIVEIQIVKNGKKNTKV